MSATGFVRVVCKVSPLTRRLSSCVSLAAARAWMPSWMRPCPWNATNPTSLPPWSAYLPRWWPHQTGTAPPPPPRTLRATSCGYLPCRCHAYPISWLVNEKHQMLRRGTTEHQPAILRRDYKTGRSLGFFLLSSDLIWCQTLHGIRVMNGRLPWKVKANQQNLAPLSTAEQEEVLGIVWLTLLPKKKKKKNTEV